MMRILLAFATTTAAIATMPPAVAAERALQRSDWEQFLKPRAVPATALKGWLGYQPELEPETPAIHYLLRHLDPYKGGVDLFLDDHGAVESARFYLVFGPIFTDEHIAKARKLRTPYTLADVEKWYGKPAERTVSHRSGADVLVYYIDGDKKRELDFTALPGSHYLHSISADRDED